MSTLTNEHLASNLVKYRIQQLAKGWEVVIRKQIIYIKYFKTDLKCLGLFLYFITLSKHKSEYTLPKHRDCALRYLLYLQDMLVEA